MYPKDAKDTINVTMIEADDAAKFHVGAMGTLTNFKHGPHLSLLLHLSPSLLPRITTIIRGMEVTFKKK